MEASSWYEVHNRAGSLHAHTQPSPSWHFCFSQDKTVGSKNSDVFLIVFTDFNFLARELLVTLFCAAVYFDAPCSYSVSCSLKLDCRFSFKWSGRPNISQRRVISRAMTSIRLTITMLTFCLTAKST